MDFPRKIYAIQHNKTKRMYIGSSCKVVERISHHMSLLRSGKHPVEDMQKDFDEHGDDFSASVLEVITEYDDRNKEYEWMRKYRSRERGIGYNYKDTIAERLERIHSCTNNQHENSRVVT